MDELDAIDELEDGAPARVGGVVRHARDVLRSPLMGRDCVYWDVRRGLRRQPERRGATVFWIESASGRILVRDDELSVDVAARRTQEVLKTVAADTHAIGERLRELKQKQRHAMGDEASQLRSERVQLADMVTYLHAVRAHARGKIHLGGKSLREQERWIEDNAPAAGANEGAASIAIAVDRYEVVIADGDHVIAEGVAQTEPAPEGIGVSAGYRESPRCRVLRAGAGGSIVITGVGASAPVRTSRDDGRSGDEGDTRDEGYAGSRPPHLDAQPEPVFERTVLMAVGVLGAVATFLWWVFGV